MSLKKWCRKDAEEKETIGVERKKSYNIKKREVK